MGLLDDVDARDEQQRRFLEKQAADLDLKRQMLDESAREFAVFAIQYSLGEHFYGTELRGWRIDTNSYDSSGFDIVVLEDGTWETLGTRSKPPGIVGRLMFYPPTYVLGVVEKNVAPFGLYSLESIRLILADELRRIRDHQQR